MQFLIVLALLLIVVLVVAAPLRRGRGEDEPAAQARRRAERQVAELEAVRDAKYREIRDAELDHSTGKLSDADHGRLDRELRAEAIEILKALDRAQAALDRLEPAPAAAEPPAEDEVPAAEGALPDAARQHDRSPA